MLLGDDELLIVLLESQVFLDAGMVVLEELFYFGSVVLAVFELVKSRHLRLKCGLDDWSLSQLLKEDIELLEFPQRPVTELVSLLAEGSIKVDNGPLLGVVILCFLTVFFIIQILELSNLYVTLLKVLHFGLIDLDLESTHEL